MQLEQLQLISMAIGVLLPILVGVVTRELTHPGVKAILLALLSAVAGFGTEFLGDPEKFIWTAALVNWLQTFIIAVATHYGLWKPTSIAKRAQAIPVSVVPKSLDSGPGDIGLRGAA
jgi:hypothetical protein